MTPRWSLDVFEPFQQFLVQVSGLYFAIDRSQTLIDKVHERMKACQISDPLGYLVFLKSGSAGMVECKNLLDVITIGETFFFRNQPQFEALRTSVLPQLFHKKRIHIWCAGCSTGEEPYSIAMELLQLLPDLSGWDISILATDINRNSLDAARRGIYRERALQLTPPEILSRYFTKTRDGYRIADEVKRLVTFQYHNLAAEPFNLPGMLDLDILFCRNVTIYFDLPTLKRIIAQFAECLAPGGTLFIGHAETLWGISDMFRPVEFPNTFLYERLSEPAPAMAAFPMPLPPPSPMTYIPPPVDPVDPVDSVKPVPQPISAGEVGVWLNQGLACANVGHYQEALDLLQKVVDADNINVGAYHLLGVVLTRMGRIDEAIAEFRHALYCDPEFAVCHFHLGNLYRFLGQVQIAQKEYRRCLDVLVNRDDAEVVPFSEGLTVGVLIQATRQALGTLSQTKGV